jgi:predicted alpha/beta hydrolase
VSTNKEVKITTFRVALTRFCPDRFYPDYFYSISIALLMLRHASAASAIRLSADDGHALGGFAWRHDQVAVPPRPVVIINAATSVRCHYYTRFAEHLFNAGADVVIYDYRGIGLSRTGSIKTTQAGWIEWGQRDFEAVLQYAMTAFPTQPIHVVGHSVGGVLIGLAPSNHRISRVFTMGAQHAYWPDYLARERLGMWLKWHCFMPAVTRVLGYFPGKRLGWLEDTPAGVVRDWDVMRANFLDTYRQPGGSCRLSGAECEALAARFAALTAPTLALSVSDDPFGTPPAIERLLKLYAAAPRWHLRITPKALNISDIGHFAFFHSRFETQLWPIARQWLLDEQLPDDGRADAITLVEFKQCSPLCK